MALNGAFWNFWETNKAGDAFWTEATAAAGTAYTLTADAGTFALSGAAVGTKVSRILPAAPGAFALAGSTVALKAARKLQAAPGAFALTGADVGLTYTPGGAPPATVRRYYRGRVAHVGAVKLSKHVYYVDE